jgi:CheY-like chemotaxis protein
MRFDTCQVPVASFTVESLTSQNSELPPERRILVAEDNPQDVLLLTEAFAAGEVAVDLHCVDDGEKLFTQLMALNGDGRDSYGMVLLDFHLPRKSAEEVLMALNARQRSFGIPLVVLTSMIAERDRRKLMDLGAHRVLDKPFDLNEYFALARNLVSILLA